MTNMKTSIKNLAIAGALAVVPMLIVGLRLDNVHAQNRTSFGGNRNAITYAYGTPASAAPPILVAVGFNPPGSTLTVQFAYVVLSDGTSINPLSTTAPISIGVGTNSETVTPTAISCPTPAIYGSCSITASFTKSHGTGDPISSATFGLEEAVNAAHTLGGLVTVDGAWAAAGGDTTTITNNKGYTNVTVLDWRGTTTAKSYTSGSNGTNMSATSVVLY